MQEDGRPTRCVETSALKSLDVGLALVVDHTDDSSVAPNQSKHVRRKIDLHILPLLFLIYTSTSNVQYLILTNCDTQKFSVQYIDKCVDNDSEIPSLVFTFTPPEIRLLQHLF